MIIRKPYAFLIKNFKRIHLIITVILAFLLYKTTSTYSYIKGLTLEEASRRSAPDYISYGLIFLILILIIAFGLIYYLMKHKKKPKTIYIISILGYILLAVLLIFTFNYFDTLKSTLVEQKTIRLYRDLFRFALAFEYIVTFIMLIRGLGFDIKKFDFKNDIKELDLSAEDAEEIEVSIKVNSSRILRVFRQMLRKLGYYVKENKLVLTIILIIVIGFSTFKIYNNTKAGNTYYSPGEYMNTYKFTMKVNNSYVTNTSYDGKTLDDYYTIVSFNVKGTTNNKNSISSTSLKLKVGGDIYYPTDKMCASFTDLGVCYKYKTISNNIYSDYILVYKIDKKNISKKMTFIYDYNYSGENTSSVRVKMTPLNLTTVDDEVVYNQNEEINFDKTPLQETTFKVTNFESGSSINYQIDKEACDVNDCNENNLITVDSEKLLLKLTINTNNESIIKNKLLKYYTQVGYTKNDTSYKTKFLTLKTGNPSILLLEVPKDLEDASEIWLDINIRNTKIKYFLKKNQ